MKTNLFQTITKCNAKKIGLLFTFLFILEFYSCKDFITVEPPATAVSSKLIFTNDAQANAAIIGIYSKMAQSGDGFASGINSITLLCGLSSDELINQSAYDDEQDEFFTNKINPSNSKLQTNWAELYNYIYVVNSIIEGLNASSGVSEVLKKQLKGEALFIRAFCHFYLVNLYGNIPIVTSTDYKINAIISASNIDQVYNFIISDLTTAKLLLSPKYINNQRTRVTNAVATAFLARVYLYHEEWEAAEKASSELIQNSNYKLESDLNNVFLTTSRESIWQIQSVVPQYNTFDGLFFIFSGEPFNVSLNPLLVKEYTLSDERRSKWINSTKPEAIDYYYPFKYKVEYLETESTPPTEYLVALRLAEQYLIRAEARAHQNKVSGAQDDLNAIRNRSGLKDTKADSQSTLLSAIENERKLELLAEWGHRWFDLKRTRMANSVLGAVKPNWSSSSIYFPIPETEKLRNPNL